ncbi:hypothetical protein NPIL_648491, partial [Nephila pilipes]
STTQDSRWEKQPNSAGGNSVSEWRQAAEATGKQQRSKEPAESEKHSEPDQTGGREKRSGPDQIRQQQHQTKADEARQHKQESQHRNGSDQARRGSIGKTVSTGSA